MNHIQSLVIEAVTTSNNNHLRKQAEAELFNLFTYNPTDFFQNCAFLITDSSRAEVNRQAVASVMKAMLRTKTEKNQFFWDLVEPSRRPDIKTSLLNNLVSESKMVMRAGANVVAGIAVIENSRGQWQDLIQMLAANTRHQSQNIRIASITTLGYICEELKYSHIRFTQNTCEQILAGIVNGLRSIEQIAQMSLQALRDSIHFLTLILGNYSYMNETFNALYELLSQGLGSKAYEVLFEMGKICYSLLSPFLQRLCKITIQHIKSRSVLSQRAMQFWDTVATEYLTRIERNSQSFYIVKDPVPNYIMQIQSILVPQIMSCMLIGSSDDLEHPELREASVRSLTSIVGCCGRQVVDIILDGVGKIIDSPLEGHRQASVLLFSCLSEHKDTKGVQQIFQKWFHKLYSLMNDNSEIVRKNTMNGFIALSQAFPYVFIQRQQQIDIFQLFFSLSQQKDEDISTLSLSILYNITQHFDYNRGNNKPFPKSKIFIQLLLSKFFKFNSTKKIKYIQTIAEIAINMLVLLTDIQSQAELLKYLMNMYYTIDDKKVVVITNLLYIICSLLLRIRKSNLLINQMIESINVFIHDLFKRLGCNIGVFEVVGAFSLIMKKDFSKVSLNQDYWKYTDQGLNRYEEEKLFKATVLCLCDVVRNSNGKYTSKIIAITKRLLGYIHTNTPFSHKYLILRYISDFCIGLGEYAETLLDKIIGICTQCFNAVYILQQSEDERDYADQLKAAIIDMYQALTWMTHKNGKVNLKVAKHFQTLSTFIVLTCQQRQNPKLNYLRQCITLLFDCTLIYKGNKTIAPIAINIINSEEVKQIIETMKLHSNRLDIQDTLQFVTEVYKKFL